MKTAPQKVRVYAHGRNEWLTLAEWLRACASKDLHPLRPQGGLCRTFRVHGIDAIEHVLSEGAAHEYLRAGCAVLYQSVHSGIELWLPVGLPVKWQTDTVTLADARE